VRHFVALIVALWVLSSGAALLHTHEGCGDEGDDAPCSICMAIHHVPAIGLSQPETREARQDVAVWISPWIAMVPDEVFFDRPLARGPPAVS
jgi:hypothetical protein